MSYSSEDDVIVYGSIATWVVVFG